MFQEAIKLATLLGGHKAEHFDREFMERSTRIIAAELLKQLEALPELQIERIKEAPKKSGVGETDVLQLERLVKVYEEMLTPPESERKILNWREAAHTIHQLEALVKQVKDIPPLKPAIPASLDANFILDFLAESVKPPIDSLYCPVSPKELSWHKWSAEHEQLHASLVKGASEFFEVPVEDLTLIWQRDEAHLRTIRQENHVKLISQVSAVFQSEISRISELDELISDIETEMALLKLPKPPTMHFKPLPRPFVEPRKKVPAVPMNHPSAPLAFTSFSDPPALSQLRDECQIMAGIISSLNK